MNDEIAHQTALAAKVLNCDMEAIMHAAMAGELVVRLTASQGAMVRESLQFTMERFRNFPYQDKQTQRERMAEVRAILAALKAAKNDARSERAP